MKAKARAKIRKKNGRWYLSTVDRAGQEVARGGFRTKADATAHSHELLGNSKSAKAPSQRAFRDYAEEWLLARANSSLSATTRDTDRTVMEAWIFPHLGDVALGELEEDPTYLDRLYAALRTGGGRGGRALRGKSVRNVHVTLSKALGDAVRRGYIGSNPVLAVDPPARDDSVTREAWTRDQVVTFLRGTASDRLAGVWRLALATGLRRGEVLGLWWDDLDLDQRTVRVSRQVLVRPRATSGAPKLFIRGTTKSRRVRLVRFDATTEAALRSWKATQSRERLAFGPAWKAGGGLGSDALWVVTEPDGAVIHPDTLSGRWGRSAKTAGVPVIPLHGARHSYATLALEAGVRLDVVSNQLGHSSVATTANIYAHVTPAAGAEAAEMMGALLAGTNEGG